MSDEKKNKKVNQLSLDEINQKIEQTKEKMGGLGSRYAFRLLQRKAELENQSK